jgi:squamous cell carcinoma antigen recognized by T-cells 3
MLIHTSSALDLRNLQRSLSARSATDVTMADTPPKEFASASLSSDDCARLKQLSEHLTKQPSDLSSHVNFINLLHKGFVQHVESGAEPADYELLAELRDSREVMDRAVPVGEALWLDWLMDERYLATDLNSSMRLLNLHQRAVTDEPASTAIWRLYGDYGYYIWSKAVSVEPQTEPSWSEEEKKAAREMLPWAQMISIWENGVAATHYSINDSNLIWDRYMEIILDNLEGTLTEAQRNKRYLKFQDRLLNYPHKTWEETFQMFSRFVTSHYDSSEYEKIMQDISSKSTQIKQVYDHRLQSEFRISQAKLSGDEVAERQAYVDYLAWEISNRGVFSFPYINGLYRRATTRFWNDAFLWTAYVEYLIQDSRHEALLGEVLERATRHCPWSGDLWSHRLLNMEAGGKAYNDVEDLKHKATAAGFLELGGLEELIKLHIAWCGYLRRRAFEPGATDEQLDIAHVGIRAALEHVQEFGYKTQGKQWTGDPQYRLERIEIKFLTQRGDLEQARHSWKDLIALRHDSYDYWYRYYIWEMVVWAKFAMRDKHEPETQLKPPEFATSVLQKALEYHTTMDSPETLLSMYLNHCEQHETVQVLRKAIIECRELQELISKRRAKEYEAATTAQQPSGDAMAVEPQQEEASTVLKRKREPEVDVDSQASKKQKEEPKRDREHAAILIKDFPLDVGPGKIRAFFSKVSVMPLTLS